MTQQAWDAALFDADSIRALVSALAVGAETSLITAEDWVKHLQQHFQGQSFIESFIFQLRQEWMPIYMPDGICHFIYSTVRRHLSMHRYYAPVWSHTLRVTGYALALAEQANVDVDHAFLLAVLHDVGKLDSLVSDQTHEALGAQIAITRLSRYMTPSIVRLIASVIAKTASSANPYRQLLFDADKLDKIGATGIVRRLSTGTSPQHVLLALRRLSMETEGFRAMHFSASRQLAEQKIAFTRQFLTAAAVLRE